MLAPEGEEGVEQVTFEVHCRPTDLSTRAPARPIDATARANGATARANGATAKANGAPASLNGAPASANDATAKENGTTVKVNRGPARPNGAPASANDATAKETAPLQDQTAPLQAPAKVGLVCSRRQMGRQLHLHESKHEIQAPTTTTVRPAGVIAVLALVRSARGATWERRSKIMSHPVSRPSPAR
jgi:hypothetical protein